MSIKLLGVDLDGTLFYPKRKIRILTKENKKFLQDFIDQGNQVLLISGRNYYIAQVIENVIKRRVDMISCNGASIHYYDKLIDENPIPKDIVKKIFKGAKDDKDIVAITFMCNRHPMVIVPTSLNKLIRPLLRLGLFFQFKYQEPYVMGKKHLYKILEDDSIHIYKIMLVTGMTKKKIITARNLLEHYQDKFGDEVEIAWSNQSLEIMKKGVNKLLHRRVAHMGEMRRKAAADCLQRGFVYPLECGEIFETAARFKIEKIHREQFEHALARFEECGKCLGEGFRGHGCVCERVHVPRPRGVLPLQKRQKDLLFRPEIVVHGRARKGRFLTDDAERDLMKGHAFVQLRAGVHDLFPARGVFERACHAALLTSSRGGSLRSLRG